MQVDQVDVRSNTDSPHRRRRSNRQKLLLGLFASHLVYLGGTVQVGDRRGQLDVLPAVCPRVTCTHRSETSAGSKPHFKRGV